MLFHFVKAWDEWRGRWIWCNSNNYVRWKQYAIHLPCWWFICGMSPSFFYILYNWSGMNFWSRVVSGRFFHSLEKHKNWPILTDLMEETRFVFKKSSESEKQVDVYVILFLFPINFFTFLLVYVLYNHNDVINCLFIHISVDFGLYLVPLVTCGLKQRRKSNLLFLLKILILYIR